MFGTQPYKRTLTTNSDELKPSRQQVTRFEEG